jgi:AcrR family transcriptional regulator
MVGRREAGRARNTAAILAAARREIAEHGGAGLSMRAVAREVGLVSSAVYRYFPTREALLTAMIVESYGNLATALEQVEPHPPDQRWRELGRALRDWGRSSPHEFQLIYGTPVPGYFAPPETIPAAARVAQPFLELGARHRVDAYDDRRLARQMTAALELVHEGEPSGVAAVLAEFAALVGMVGLELAGHFVGTADPADRLYNALLDRQVQTLALTPPTQR